MIDIWGYLGREGGGEEMRCLVSGYGELGNGVGHSRYDISTNHML